MEKQCVIVLDEWSSAGLAANTAAILGVAMGNKTTGLVGEDVLDASDLVHVGIVRAPVPILKGSRELLRELRDRTMQPKFADLLVIAFTTTAQAHKSYEAYVDHMGKTASRELEYLGLGLYGPVKMVRRLTGSLPLFR